MGGGWSFSDSSLPQTTQQAVDATSILKRGANGTEDLSHVLQGLKDVTNSAMDLQPENIVGDLSLSRRYNQQLLTQSTDSGANLPMASGVSIIDTRGLASSLQSQLSLILSSAARAATAPGANGTAPSTFYFHVEAGITMADLDQLLDHQSPRLALQASGGSVGATLAGTISTATHGAEFGWPLLVDRVRAIHLVGPGGQEWWIEGDTSIADVDRLQQVYPGIDTAHFVGGNRGLGGIAAQDVLNAVIVSMGTMGVFYSVVLEVVPQFGLQQISIALIEKAVFPVGRTTGWSQLLASAGTTGTALRSGDSTANLAVLQFLLDGTKNGTGIPFDAATPPGTGKNVFADLAINPINLDCWITNRRVTPDIPVDSNRPDPDFLPAIDEALGKRASDTVNSSRLLGRVFDFLDWATDVPSANVSDDINVIQQALRLGSFVTTYPDMLVSAVAALNVQAVANAANASDHPDRGHQFLGDALTGFLNAVQGTTLQGTTRKLGDTTDVSYKIWGFGWPTNGVPGRGLEIALPQERAFTFLQNVLFDDVLANTMTAGNKPLIGYISVRICPPTRTLMGMQQFAPFSVMIEVVGYRSPEANVVMDVIQQKALDPKSTSPDGRRVNAMLHWGLENDQMTSADLLKMPMAGTKLLKSPGFTRLSAFLRVRQLLIDGHAPSPFENNFVRRLGL